MTFLTISSLTEALILASALSVDALIACFAYGSRGIRIPVRSVITITLVCGGILLISLLIGRWSAPYIAERFIKIICFATLFLLGVTRIFDSSLKNWIRKKEDMSEKLRFSVFNLNFILNIYANPHIADIDRSRTLSAGEAAALSVALSLDGAFAGIGAGLMGSNLLLTVLIFLLFTVGAVLLGCRLGNRLASKISFDVSWLSGVLLIILAFIKI